MPQTATHASGACLCGAVRFRVPLPSLWVAHCHCTRCQRAHGAAFVTWVGVVAAQAELTDPQARLRWHVTDQGAERGFCGCCGSPMFFRSPRWPGELHIARALFVDALDRAPEGHSHFESRVPWVLHDASLPIEPSPEAELPGPQV
jgi:hypothetical protein